MDLKDLYNKHKELELPEFPENDEFAEWVEELIEMDAYYVGLISSRLSGSREEIDESHFIKMNENLKQYTSIKADKDIYDQCIKYMKSLYSLIELAKN